MYYQRPTHAFDDARYDCSRSIARFMLDTHKQRAILLRQMCPTIVVPLILPTLLNMQSHAKRAGTDQITFARVARPRRAPLSQQVSAHAQLAAEAVEHVVGGVLQLAAAE